MEPGGVHSSGTHRPQRQTLPLQEAGFATWDSNLSIQWPAARKEQGVSGSSPKPPGPSCSFQAVCKLSLTHLSRGHPSCKTALLSSTSSVSWLHPRHVLCPKARPAPFSTQAPMVHSRSNRHYHLLGDSPNFTSPCPPLSPPPLPTTSTPRI